MKQVGSARVKARTGLRMPMAMTLAAAASCLLAAHAVHAHPSEASSLRLDTTEADDTGSRETARPRPHLLSSTSDSDAPLRTKSWSLGGGTHLTARMTRLDRQRALAIGVSSQSNDGQRTMRLSTMASSANRVGISTGVGWRW